MHPAGFEQRGYTLAELMLVVAVLALMAAITIAPTNERNVLRLQRGALSVVAALDYARAEAERTGTPHGVRVQSATRISVFRLDTATMPPGERYDVRQPVDKSLYTVDLDADPFTAGTRASGYFVYQGAGTGAAAISFDARGEGMRGDDSVPLATGGIVLVNDVFTLGVGVAPLTGRVTVGAVRGTVANAATLFPAAVQP